MEYCLFEVLSFKLQISYLLTRRMLVADQHAAGILKSLCADIGVCVCACVSTPRLLIITHVK